MKNNAFDGSTLPAGYYFINKDSIDPSEIIALRKSVGWKGDTLDRWQISVNQSLVTVGVRDRNSELVGMACIAGNVRHAVFCDLAVSPAHQRKGVGTAIMSELMTATGALGVTYVYAELAKTNPFRDQMIQSGFEVTGDSLFKEATLDWPESNS